MRYRAAAAGRSLLVVLLLAGLGGCAAMRDAAVVARDVLQPSPPGPKPTSAEAAAALPDAEIERRLAFITQRLDDGRTHAFLWQWGFFALNAGGMIAGAAVAPGDEGDDQVYDIIAASKGLIGVLYLLTSPMPGRHGADPIRDMPAATHAERAAQLAAAEALLYETAGRSYQRTSWVLHAGNAAINAAGASVLLAREAYGKAAQSFFIDFTVGEAQILLQPWQPLHDWKDYEQFTTGVPPEPQARWQLVPQAEGLALRLEF